MKKEKLMLEVPQDKKYPLNKELRSDGKFYIHYFSPAENSGKHLITKSEHLVGFLMDQKLEINHPLKVFMYADHK